MRNSVVDRQTINRRTVDRRPDSGEDPSVEFDDVTVSLGGARVLDAVSATVEVGRFVGLVGPNGAGKTTLLRTVNGRIEPDAGTVAVEGKRVSGLSAKAVGRLVATVPQRTELSFPFPVRDVVEMGRFPHRSRLGLDDPGADRIDWAMERTEVAHLADRPVTETSGGERQRVLLARALAQDTPVLLLDEPTASLDVNHQVRTLSLVRNLVDDEGRTVLAAIHDLDLAARFCDELVLLSDGRVQATGAPEAVLSEASIEGAFDTPAAVGKNPMTGTPTVTATTVRSHSARSPPARSQGDGQGHVHVIGGGGRATALLHRLAGAGYSLSVGVLHEDDTDAQAARALGLSAVTVPPFTPVDDGVEVTDDGVEAAVVASFETAVEIASERARAADVTVLADVDVGPANVANLAVAEAADRLVVVEGRPFADRNHVGETTADRYTSIVEAARVVPEADVVAAVAAEISATRAVAADGGSGRGPDGS